LFSSDLSTRDTEIILEGPIVNNEVDIQLQSSMLEAAEPIGLIPHDIAIDEELGVLQQMSFIEV